MKALFFYKPNHNDCQLTERQLDIALSQRNFDCAKIDVTTEEGKKVKDKYNALLLPTLLLIGDNGKAKKRETGTMKAQRIKQFLGIC